MLDLLDHMNGNGDAQRYYYTTDGHFNGAGNARVAQAIYSDLLIAEKRYEPMSNPLLDGLQRNPQTVDQSIVLRDGTHLDTRLHRSTDGERLAHYFTHLSEATDASTAPSLYN